MYSQIGLGLELAAGRFHDNAPGIQLRLDHDFYKHIGAAAQFVYIFKIHGVPVIELNANIHWILPINQNLKFYLVTGVNHSEYLDSILSSPVNQTKFNLGFGLQYPRQKKWVGFLEGKKEIGNPTYTNVSAGVIYHWQ